MTLSEELAGIATNTPEKLDLTENIVAPTRFRAASDEGLSDDLCAPTYTTGMERFCKAKLRASAVCISPMRNDNSLISTRPYFFGYFISNQSPMF